MLLINSKNKRQQYSPALCISFLVSRSSKNFKFNCCIIIKTYFPLAAKSSTRRRTEKKCILICVQTSSSVQLGCTKKSRLATTSLQVAAANIFLVFCSLFIAVSSFTVYEQTTPDRCNISKQQQQQHHPHISSVAKLER